MVSEEYTVRLERLFQGPMDLLLHLVREQEVDIQEIEINRVVDGYLEYLGRLQEIDIELAGDFVVMAASLMAIKARSLLPSEEVDLEQDLDPRDELIQRLIEYRRFKEASQDLGERFERRSRLFPRGDVRARIGAELSARDEPTIEVGDLTVWDLLATYSRLRRETLADHRMRIESDDRPMRYYVEQLVRWIKRERELGLRELVAHASDGADADHHQLVGTFCALLEVMRLGVVSARQTDGGGDIRVRLRDEHADDIEDVVRASGFDDERGTEAAPPA